MQSVLIGCVSSRRPCAVWAATCRQATPSTVCEGHIEHLRPCQLASVGGWVLQPAKAMKTADLLMLHDELELKSDCRSLWFISALRQTTNIDW
jgi:hypothetical protein